MKTLIALINKDICSEIRAKESLGLQVCLALLLSSMVSLGAYNAFFSPREIQSIAPLFLWLIFLFSSTLALTRSFEYELKLGGLWGIYLSGVSPSVIFISKVISNLLITVIGQIVTVAALVVLLNLNWSGAFLPLLLISLGVIVGYSSLSTLLTLVALRSKLRGMLLPIILFPLLFPLLFAALELTHQYTLNQSTTGGSPWVSLLIGLDLIYLILGLNLFGSLLEE